MCVCFFSIQPEKNLSFLLAMNRDERWDRKTSALQVWKGENGLEVLAGRDEEAGGTWLGVNRAGQIAWLTNLWTKSTREQEGVRGSSRGLLVWDFLQKPQKPLEYLKSVQSRVSSDSHYPGFNLVVGDFQKFYYLRKSDDGSEITPLVPGTYGLSNSSLSEPWLKVHLGIKEFEKDLERVPPEISRLWNLLRQNPPIDSSRQVPSSESRWTPERRALTERIFISSPVYGTRSSSVVWRASSGALGFVEQSYDSKSNLVGKPVLQEWGVSHSFG